MYGWQVSRVINIVAGSAELGVNIPELDGRFHYNVCDIAGSYFSCSLVFNVDEMSIALNTDNLISGSPL